MYTMNNSENISLEEFSTRFKNCFVFKPIERPKLNEHIWCLWDMYKERITLGEKATVEQFAEFALEPEALEILGMQCKATAELSRDCKNGIKWYSKTTPECRKALENKYGKNFLIVEVYRKEVLKQP